MIKSTYSSTLRFSSVILLIVFGLHLSAQTNDSLTLRKTVWIDSVYQSLKVEERIGQVFMIRAHSNKTATYHQNVENLIKNHNVGGLCFFQGGPGRQIDLVNRYQKKAKTPLLIAIDGEWGISMRLDSVEKFPRQMTLGAIQNDSLIYLMGEEVARQAKMVGVHINFAPVADVNNNPMNPVINNRSFSENPDIVAAKTYAYMSGMQDQGVMACAKHFPGHGDTDKDSHKTLPIVNASRQEMDSIHLKPFKYLSEKGIGSMMIAHLHIPSLNTVEGTATTLTKSVVTDLLRGDLGFKGLIITDALEMKGVSNYHTGGELAVKAIQAGNDILLMPNDVGVAIASIKKALKEGRIDSTLFEDKVRRILAAKYDYKLYNKQHFSKANLNAKLNSEKTQSLIQSLHNASLTLVKNDSNLLPLKPQLESTFAVLNIGDNKVNTFVKEVRKFQTVKTFSLPGRASMEDIKKTVAQLETYDYVIVNILGTNNSASKNYKVYQSSISLLQLLKNKGQVVCNVFANPYSVNRFEDITGLGALLVAYQDNDYAMKAAANAIFGGLSIDGKLPFSKSKKYPAGWGLKTSKNRLGFVGGNFKKIGNVDLKAIDRIAKEGIQERAYPGCQILVAKDGVVLYQKSFGHQTYKKEIAITNESIYDLASVTKVLATTMSLMKLSDNGDFNVDKRLSYYLKQSKGTNKEYIVIRDILAHQARLAPWIPFYRHSMNGKQLDSVLYKDHAARGYEAQVAKNIFMLESYHDTILNDIFASDLLPRKKYKYSDLGMYLMKEIIEQQTSMRLDEYCNKSFYFPLGLNHTAFNPMQRFELEDIVPTEYDNYFRNQTIKGYVHDQGAAMIGGISGHAGLFSNSLDVAVLMQMILQKGYYGGMQYIDTATIEDFTRRQFPLNSNRRGLGFDRPLENPEEGGPTCPYVSQESFGHSGFTGTYVWTDPRYNITYVFLSNRTYPSAENRKLIQLDIRTRIQEEIYRAFDLVQEKPNLP